MGTQQPPCAHQPLPCSAACGLCLSLLLSRHLQPGGSTSCPPTPHGMSYPPAEPLPLRAGCSVLCAVGHMPLYHPHGCLGEAGAVSMLLDLTLQTCSWTLVTCSR